MANCVIRDEEEGKRSGSNDGRRKERRGRDEKGVIEMQEKVVLEYACHAGEDLISREKGNKKPNSCRKSATFCS